MKIDNKVSITPEAWVNGTFEEFEKYLKSAKVLSTKIKPAWNELQSSKKVVVKPKEKSVKSKDKPVIEDK